MGNTKINLSCHNGTGKTTGGKELDRHKANIGKLFSGLQLQVGQYRVVVRIGNREPFAL